MVLEGLLGAAALAEMSQAENADRPEYTIDELAALARLPSRTIRFYQSRGALMPPEIRGRVAYYGPAHLERLKLIAQLQDRGLSIDAIRDLLASIDKGELDLAEWLASSRRCSRRGPTTSRAPWARPSSTSSPERRDRASSAISSARASSSDRAKCSSFAARRSSWWQ